MFNAHRMPASKGIRCTELIYMLNLFTNRFDVLYPVARYHTISFKYEMVGSGNILEALGNGLRSDVLIQWIYSTFPHSILMT